MSGENENKNLDYGPVIADLEAKKRFLEKTIAALKAVSAGAINLSIGDDLGGLSDNVSVTIHGGDIPAGAFLGKSIPEAAKLYLSIVKRKQTSKEIADALLKYGIETSAKNFSIQVHSILHRAQQKVGSGIEKLGRSYWGLAEWYPAGLRSTGAAQTKKSKKGRKAAAKGRKEKETASAKPKIVSGPKEPGVMDKIGSLLKNKPSTEFSAQEIATSLGQKTQVVHLLMGKLIGAKVAEKTAGGKFKAVSAKLSASA